MNSFTSLITTLVFIASSMDTPLDVESQGYGCIDATIGTHVIPKSSKNNAGTLSIM